jgi:hypothetical protein
VDLERFDMPLDNQIEKMTSALRSDLTGILLNLFQIAVTGATVFSYVPWSKEIFIFVTLFFMFFITIVQFIGIIEMKIYQSIMLCSIVCLGIGLVLNFQENKNATKVPLIQAKAFVDLRSVGIQPYDEKKGSFERYISRADNIMISFTPQTSKYQDSKLDNIAVFNLFEAGEKVTIKICDIEREIQTYPENDPRYSLSYDVVFPIAEEIFKRCAKNSES